MLPRSPVLALAMLSAAGCGAATASSPAGSGVPAATAGSSTDAAAPAAPGADAGTPVTGGPVKTPCSLKAADLAATHPAAPNEPVYGSNPYTDDSSLCTAAHYAGLLGPGARKFTVTISGPKGAFRGSTANGVTTLPFGQYGGSVTVAKSE